LRFYRIRKSGVNVYFDVNTRISQRQKDPPSGLKFRPAYYYHPIFAIGLIQYFSPYGGIPQYFHHKSVLNDDFDRLEIGSGVRFAKAAGKEGPKAGTVQIIDKPAE
jgi:cold shock CspA family protein